ncbi:MAG: hypothetical protein DRO40_11275 [Thermoprotei archaeon]|nr:MAG: hypothetical protein DRO40_11275 [Thermoprotei archaeon]
MNQLTLVLEIRTRSEIVNSLYKSMHPDNLFTPSNMSIEEEIDSRNGLYRISIRVPLNSRYIKSSRQTLDEILGLMTVIRRIMKY